MYVFESKIELSYYAPKVRTTKNKTLPGTCYILFFMSLK
jgi:hypothetical protein